MADNGYALAIIESDRVLELDSHNATALLNKGGALMCQGRLFVHSARYDLAMNSCDQAVATIERVHDSVTGFVRSQWILGNALAELANTQALLHDHEKSTGNFRVQLRPITWR